MNLLKNINLIGISILVLSTFSACSDETESIIEEPPTLDNGTESEEKDSVPTFLYTTLSVKEEKPSDAQTITLTQTFNYKENKLNSFQSIQSYTAVEPFELKNETTISYQNNKAIITDGYNTSIYLLNEFGYATQCIRNEGRSDERKYIFKYALNEYNWHYLNQIEEYLTDGKLYSKVILEPNEEGIMITQEIESFKQNYIANTLNDINISGIPHPFLVDLHPLSMHTAALYGRLIGEPSLNMITKVTPVGSEENVGYSFEKNDEGWFTSCKITTIHQKYRYTRKINYNYTR